MAIRPPSGEFIPGRLDLGSKPAGPLNSQSSGRLLDLFQRLDGLLCSFDSARLLDELGQGRKLLHGQVGQTAGMGGRQLLGAGVIA